MQKAALNHIQSQKGDCKIVSTVFMLPANRAFEQHAVSMNASLMNLKLESTGYLKDVSHYFEWCFHCNTCLENIWNILQEIENNAKVRLIILLPIYNINLMTTFWYNNLQWKCAVFIYLEMFDCGLYKLFYIVYRPYNRWLRVQHEPFLHLHRRTHHSVGCHWSASECFWNVVKLLWSYLKILVSGYIWDSK